jgi:hypothetical protein
MKATAQRLLALEIQRARCQAAEAAPPGFSADDLLAEMIRFLERPRAQQRAQCPGYTDAELDWLVRRLPRYRRAWRGPGKGRR